MNKYYYKVYIRKGLVVKDIVSVDYFDDVKNGFWIDEQCKFTSFNRGKVWIPVSSIEYILKVEIK